MLSASPTQSRVLSTADRAHVRSRVGLGTLVWREAQGPPGHCTRAPAPLQTPRDAHLCWNARWPISLAARFTSSGTASFSASDTWYTVWPASSRYGPPLPPSPAVSLPPGREPGNSRSHPDADHKTSQGCNKGRRSHCAYTINTQKTLWTERVSPPITGSALHPPRPYSHVTAHSKFHDMSSQDFASQGSMFLGTKCHPSKCIFLFSPTTRWTVS